MYVKSLHVLVRLEVLDFKIKKRYLNLKQVGVKLSRYLNSSIATAGVCLMIAPLTPILLVDDAFYLLHL